MHARTEIGDAAGAVVGDEHVLRLEVAVRDLRLAAREAARDGHFRVQVLEAGCDVQQHAHALLHALDRVSLQLLVERAARVVVGHDPPERRRRRRVACA